MTETVEILAIEATAFVTEVDVAYPLTSAMDIISIGQQGPPGVQAGQVTPTVVMDPAVQAADIDTDGDSTIDDAGLQSATENAINKML